MTDGDRLYLTATVTCSKPSVVLWHQVERRGLLVRHDRADAGHGAEGCR